MRRTQTRAIGDILEEFFKRPYVARKIAEGKLPEFWREVVGEHVASLTNEVRLANNILYVRLYSGDLGKKMATIFVRTIIIYLI